MKSFKLIKVIASSLIVASVLALNPIGASAEWKENSTGWWYTEGNSWAAGWRLISGNWYYFYSDGYMAKNTTIDGYYLNGSGAWTNSTPTGTKVTLNDADYNNKMSDICTRIKAWKTSYSDIINKANNDSTYIMSDTFKQNMRDSKNEIDAIYKEAATFSPSDKFTELNNSVVNVIRFYDEGLTLYNEGINENNITKINKGDELIQEGNEEALKLVEITNKLKQNLSK